MTRQERKDFIWEHWNDMNNIEMAEALKCSNKTISALSCELGLHRNDHKAKVDYIIDNYLHKTDVQIAKELKCSVYYVRGIRRDTCPPRPVANHNKPDAEHHGMPKHVVIPAGHRPVPSFSFDDQTIKFQEWRKRTTAHMEVQDERFQGWRQGKTD